MQMLPRSQIVAIVLNQRGFSRRCEYLQGGRLTDATARIAFTRNGEQSGDFKSLDRIASRNRSSSTCRQYELMNVRKIETR